MEEWANKVMMTNSSVSNWGNQVPWKSKVIRWPVAIESFYISPLGSMADRSPGLQRKCRFTWCGMMFFLLGRAVLWAGADEICSALYLLWAVFAWTKPHFCAFLEKELATLFLHVLNSAASHFQFVAINGELLNSGWSKVQQQRGQKGEKHSEPWRELGYLPRSSIVFSLASQGTQKLFQTLLSNSE